MSTRWYPLYQKGNPQLRVFLPNFWMKLVRPPLPDSVKPNSARFKVSMGMSQEDVKNYLEKIYGVPVVYARTSIFQGRFKRVPRKGYIVKEDDYKVAYVVMPKGYTFKFPDVYPEEKIDGEIDSEKKNLDRLEKNYVDYLKRNALRKDVPGWFL